MSAKHFDDNRDASRFRRLVNALDHAIVWEFDDTAGEYTFVSEHAKLVLGYDAAAWMRDPNRFERCIVSEDLPSFLALVAKLRSGTANDLRLEHRCVTADGATLWVHTGIHRADERGQVLLRGVTIDINSIKLAEERERKARESAEDATRSLEEILAIVAHDVQNPMNVLVSAVDLLSQRAADHEKAIATIGRSARRLSRLVDDLVDLGSIRARRLSVAESVTTTESLLSEALEGGAAAAGAGGVTLRALPGASVTVRCDPKRIAQVLANLVGNAIKFTPRGGKVELSAGADPNEVLFRVADTGVGLAPESLRAVFERAWQAPETSRLGRGLGLFIAKGIIDAHAGRIWAESSLGEGTTFQFALPRSKV